MRQFVIVAGVGIALGGAGAGVASADLHTWDVTEIYSDASGSVQFIELVETDGLNNQQRLSNSLAFPNHTITSTANTYTFTTNLPSNITANKRFLLGTAGYAALPGAVAPDYVIPSNFFSVGGDTLNFSGGVDIFTFTGAEYPLFDPQLSLVGTNPPLSTAPNSPTNFAGQVGSIPEPAAFAIGGLFAAAAVARRRSRSPR